MAVLARDAEDAHDRRQYLNPEVAGAEEFSPLLGIPAPILAVAVDRRTYGVTPITPDVVAKQQAIADVFFELGLIPKAIKIADAVKAPLS